MQLLIKKILFPTDFSESVNTALDSAINIAKKFDSKLVLLHVLPEDSDNEELKKLVSIKMEEFVSKVRAHQLDCYYELIAGNPADIILQTAQRKKVNLIVLGASKEKKMEFKLGSSSEKIIKNASVPVWVIEKNKPLSVNNVLCPVDFSEESKIALDNAAHICRKYDAKLTVLNVIKSFKDDYKSLGITIENKNEDTSSTELDNFLNEINLKGVDWKKEIIIGKPANEILNYIANNNIGLIVMGATGKTGLKKILMGSVTEKVTRKVPCSFIISKSNRLIHLKLDKNLSDIDQLYQEGEQLFQDGFTKEAIEIWEQCTALNELYLKAWAAIANAYESLGEKAKAKKYLEKKNKIQRSIWDKQVEANLRGNHNLFKP